MNYLAIDTASSTLKILLCHSGGCLYFQSADFRSASERLMVETDRLLKAADMTAGDLDALACVIGPGSFTGIRIGMATVKAFSYALGIKTIPVNTLQLLAYNNNGKSDTVVAVCDAGNGYRYVGVYDENCREVMEPRCLKSAELSDFIGLIDEPHVVFCDEVSLPDIPNGIVPDSESFKYALQKAAESGTPCDYNDIEPLYIRKPQAELDLEGK